MDTRGMAENEDNNGVTMVMMDVVSQGLQVTDTPVVIENEVNDDGVPACDEDICGTPLCRSEVYERCLLYVHCPRATAKTTTISKLPGRNGTEIQ